MLKTKLLLLYAMNNHYQRLLNNNIYCVTLISFMQNGLAWEANLKEEAVEVHNVTLTYRRPVIRVKKSPHERFNLIKSLYINSYLTRLLTYSKVNPAIFWTKNHLVKNKILLNHEHIYSNGHVLPAIATLPKVTSVFFVR